METATRELGGETVSARRLTAAPRHYAIAILTALVIAGFLLRAIGVADPSLSHPEIYIPGIGLSPETVTPPPRHGLWETLVWHFHEEPHPIGYYMAMLGWTSLFGDSELALRAPAILLGSATILLVYGLGAALYGRAAGAAAAALLAFHGFHIFWSGMARMYVPGAFFGLLATYLLVRISTGARRQRALGAGYVASLVAALFTTELNWAVFAAHVGWAAFFSADAKRPRLAVLHFFALAVSAPALLHAVYLARGEAAADPSFDFLVQYLAFGFLFEGDGFSDPVRFVHRLVIVGGLLLCVLLVAAGLVRRTRPPLACAAVGGATPAWGMGAAAAVSVAITLWLSTTANARNAVLAVVSMLPIAALAWPFAARSVRPTLRTIAPPLERALGRVDPFTVLIALLALAVPLGILVASLGKSVAASRAFIVFVPYLLILAGAGLAGLRVRWIILAATATATAALFGASLVHAGKRPASPIDYKGLGAAISERLGESDIVLIRRREWIDAPLTYYVPHEAVIGNQYAERIAGAPRVWAIRWADHRIAGSDIEIARALADYRLCETVTARRGAAKLYALDAAGCAPKAR